MVRGRLKVALLASSLTVAILILYRTYGEGGSRNSFVVGNDAMMADRRTDEGSRKTAADVEAHRKFVHLDLKGAPPKVHYLSQVFPLLKRLGADGLLIEYEDTFPYKGPLSEVPALNAYTEAEVLEIARHAAEAGLEVVPLVQTFGHMEFVLKLASMKGLREVAGYPQAICPSRNLSRTYVRAMVDQVMALHAGSRYLHVGCDEVYRYGECEDCADAMARMRWDREDLFLGHVRDVADYAKRAHGVRALIWDDMLRNVPENTIRASGVGDLVQVLVWRYDANVAADLTRDVWLKYAACFTGVWVATAFKGATGPAQYATPIRHHLDNHVAWKRVTDEYADTVPFKGTVITGWSRYDHFGTLCELLPAGIPSLAVDLAFLRRGRVDEALFDEARESLGCNRPLPLDLNDTADAETLRCDFPGDRVYEALVRFNVLRGQVDSLMASSEVTGWMGRVNLRTRFSSPAHLERAALLATEAARNVTAFRADMERAMGPVYDGHTVAEWMETFVEPMMARLNRLEETARVLMDNDRVWPRRPLNFSSDDSQTGRLLSRR